MLAEERRSRIQECLTQRGAVTISELAELFGTSEMTIRRDLDELETRGVCQRIHGGAMSLRVMEPWNPIYPSFAQREQWQVSEKTAIGRAAAALVNPGDTIAIDSGTTAAHMAQALRSHQAITVVTNSLRVLDQLYDVTSISLISPGGTLSLEGLGAPGGGDISFVGPIAVNTLRSFRPKKAFIATSSMSVSDGISNANLFQAEIKRTLLEISEEAILITDHSKFGRASGFIVANASAFSKVITDTLAPEQDVAALRELGIEVIQVEPASDVVPLRPFMLPVSAAERAALAPGDMNPAPGE